MILDGAALDLPDGARVGLVGDPAACSALLVRIAREAGDAAGLFDGPRDFGRDTLRRAASPALSLLAELERDAHQVTEARADPTADIELLQAEQQRLREEYDALGGVALRHAVHDVLFGLGFVEEELRTPVARLDDEQRRRLALARVLCDRPALLLLDEPARGLDPPAARWLLRHLDGWPGAVVVASADPQFLRGIADTLIELDDGRIGRARPSRRLPAQPEAARPTRPPAPAFDPSALDDAALSVRITECEQRFERLRDTLARPEIYEPDDSGPRIAALVEQFDLVEQELLALYGEAERRSV